MCRHAHLFKGIGGEFKPDLAARAPWIEDFDEAITRVSFGWPSVAAYYAGVQSALVRDSRQTLNPTFSLNPNQTMNPKPYFQA